MGKKKRKEKKRKAKEKLKNLYAWFSMRSQNIEG